MRINEFFEGRRTWRCSISMAAERTSIVAASSLSPESEMRAWNVDRESEGSLTVSGQKPTGTHVPPSPASEDKKAAAI
jgi:hypothetical protein